MEAIELELFNDNKTANSSIPKTASTEKVSLPTQPDNPQKVLEKALNSIFISPQEENKLAKARRILGPEITTGVSDEQLDVFIGEVQLLLDSWFDTFERKVFEGHTLREILRGEIDEI